MKYVEAGMSHSIALTRGESKVYGWGQAEHGAIGMRLVNSHSPSEIKFEESNGKIKQIACGSRHSAFLNSEGEVMMCGAGS